MKTFRKQELAEKILSTLNAELENNAVDISKVLSTAYTMNRKKISKE